MHKRSPATPMSQNEYRIMLQGLICQELFITSVLQRSQSGQQAADSFCQPILAFVGSTDVTTARYILECFPSSCTPGRSITSKGRSQQESMIRLHFGWASMHLLSLERPRPQAVGGFSLRA